MDKEQCYKLLNLKKDYTKKELKHAYQEMSKRYHPDVVGSSGKQHFIKINAAYKTLSSKFSKKALVPEEHTTDVQVTRQKNNDTNTVKITPEDFFNKNFEEARANATSEDYFIDLGSSSSDFKERTLSEFRQENESINTMIATQQRLINSYNPQTFNNYFEGIKQANTEIDLYEPVHENDMNRSSFGSMKLSEVGMFQTPENINYNNMFVMKEQPLTQKEIGQRLSDRESIFSYEHNLDNQTMDITTRVNLSSLSALFGCHNNTY